MQDNLDRMELRNKISKIPPLIFNERYKIIDLIDKGSFGLVLEAIDLENENKSVICKINKSRKMNEFEGEILKQLNETGSNSFPKLLNMGFAYNKPYMI